MNKKIEILAYLFALEEIVCINTYGKYVGIHYNRKDALCGCVCFHGEKIYE